MLLFQMYTPNSPQCFNTGLEMAYGITGEPEGHWHYDTTKGEVVKVMKPDTWHDPKEFLRAEIERQMKA